VMSWCTAQYKMLLFCAETIVKELHNFELASVPLFCSLIPRLFPPLGLIACSMPIQKIKVWEIWSLVVTSDRQRV